MRSFRKVLHEVLMDMVVRLPGSASPEADTHREAVFDLFLPINAEDPHTVMLLSIASRCANGDYQNTREVQHHCFGCCATEGETKALFVTAYIRSLASRDPHRFRRGSWTEARPFFRTICIFGMQPLSFAEGVPQVGDDIWHSIVTYRLGQVAER